MYYAIIIHKLKSGNNNMIALVAPTKRILWPVLAHPKVIAWRLRDRTGWCDSANWQAFGLHKEPATAHVLWNEIYAKEIQIFLD